MERDRPKATASMWSSATASYSSTSLAVIPLIFISALVLNQITVISGISSSTSNGGGAGAGTGASNSRSSTSANSNGGLINTPNGESNANLMDNSLGFRSMFTTKNNTKIIVQRGGVAVLPCGVRINSQATVSWIRRRDYQLLTVGQTTYSSDERFSSDAGRHLGVWSLRIKAARDADNGLYECQLSVYPPQSVFVELKIIEAITEIGDGTSDVHIDEGSTLRLECKLRYATELPTFVFWYFSDRMINYAYEEGYLVQDIHKYYNQTATSATTNLNLIVSILLVNSVNKKHAGNYSCSPSNAKSAQVTVHVLHDEKPAAMQHANLSNNVKLNFTLVQLLLFLNFVVFR